MGLLAPGLTGSGGEEHPQVDVQLSPNKATLPHGCWMSQDPATVEPDKTL